MATELENLVTLELSPRELIHLTPEERKNKIRKQYFKLSLKYHPDKNINSEDAPLRFQAINKAYKELIKIDVTALFGINTYIGVKKMDIPDTAFDLLLEEAIAEAYIKLIQSFARLNTEEEKKKFATKYADFIHLAQNLEKKQDDLNRQRAKSVSNNFYLPLSMKLRLQHRRLVMAFFAEEFLDDFKYRHALATGELWAILAARKLLNPIKLVAFLISSILLFLTLSVSYYWEKKLALPLVTEAFRLRNDVKQGQSSMRAIVFYFFKLLVLLSLFCTPFIFFLTPSILVFTLPVLASLLKILACPVNLIVRPISTYLGVSPILGSAVMASLIAVTTLGFVFAFASIPSLAILLLPACIILNMYNFFSLLQAIKKCYDNHPEIGLIYGVAYAARFLIGFLIPPLLGNILIPYFLLSLINAVDLYKTNGALLKLKMGYETEALPLPKEPVPEEVKEATLNMVTTAQQSHRFFNTPKKADYLLDSDRTFTQKTASFFGGGARYRPAAETYTPELIPTLAT